MNGFAKTFGTTVGKKFIAGLTGLGLVGFIVGHLAGNLNLLRGTDAMDVYAEELHHLSVLHFPLFAIIEWGLFALFVVHIGTVLTLAMRNKGARGSRYAVTASKRADAGASARASKTMVVSGLILVAFLVVHLSDFRLQREAIEAGEGIGVAVIEALQVPWKAALYIAGSLVVGWHVMHGLHSAFRSLGLNHKKYTPLIEKASIAIAAAVALGFSMLAVLIVAGVITTESAPFESSGDHDNEVSAPTDIPHAE